MTTKLAQEIALRYAALSSARKLEAGVREALALMLKVQAWGSKFSLVLSRARNDGLGAGWVWQDGLIEYFSEYELLSSDMRLIEKSLSNLSFDDQELGDLTNLALDAVYEPPRKARPDYALETFEFFPDPSSTEENIAYKVQKLKEWSRTFQQWAARSVHNLHGVLKKVGQKS